MYLIHKIGVSLTEKYILKVLKCLLQRKMQLANGHWSGLSNEIHTMQKWQKSKNEVFTKICCCSGPGNIKQMLPWTQNIRLGFIPQNSTFAATLLKDAYIVYYACIWSKYYCLNSAYLIGVCNLTDLYLLIIGTIMYVLLNFYWPFVKIISLGYIAYIIQGALNTFRSSCLIQGRVYWFKKKWSLITLLIQGKK